MATPGTTHTATSDAPPFNPSTAAPQVTTPPSIKIPSPPGALSSLPPNHMPPPSPNLSAQELATDQAASPSTEPNTEKMPPTYIDAVPAIPPQSQSPDNTTGLVAGNVPEQKESAAFTAAWTDAHNKLETGRYAEALAVLSVWYDNPLLVSRKTINWKEFLGNSLERLSIQRKTCCCLHILLLTERHFKLLPSPLTSLGNYSQK